MPLAFEKPAHSRRNPARPAPRPRRRWLGLALTGLAAIGVGAGCQTTGNSPLALWRFGHDDSLSKPPTEAELGKDDRNFMLRWLRPKTPPPANVDTPGLVLGSDGWRPMANKPNPEAEAEFHAAEALFQQGKFAEAEPLFKQLAKKRKGSVWGEKGQFYLAETQYQSGKLVAAHDSFDLLEKDYQGTEFNEKVIAREFAIAQAWLAQSDPKAPAEAKLPWYAHFNGQMPLIDTQGHAIRALEHVRHYNPKGPLADDAVLRIADEYMGNKDYETAAMYYDQLITDHPKSPFLQRAQLAAIDARMKGYVGPEYDGAGLEKARELVKQTMATFPDRAVNNEKLYHTLDLINDQDAERTYVVGNYYRRAGYPESAEYYFAKIPQRWPKSPWASKAKTQLASLAKVPRKRHDPSKIMTQPGSTDSMGGSQGGMGGMGGMGMGGMGMGGMGGPGGMM
jgi:outer membrane protein assembly factor BamD (BamD/ComL family)